MTYQSKEMKAVERSLLGKTALVTGSTSGIGLGVAQALARAGANVVLNGLGEPRTIARIACEVARANGVDAIYSGADLSRPQEIETMMDEAIRRFGAVDILVNNAGIQHVAPVESFPVEKWDLILSINLSSAFHTARLALPAMRDKGWGRIVNIASAHGLVASPFKSAYVAAKHGIVGLTKVTALENAKANITCNAICPGWVLTPLVEKQIEARAKANNMSYDEASIDLLSEKQPSHRFVKIEELGHLALFLSSDLSSSITGTTISMDGGWTAQ